MFKTRKNENEIATLKKENESLKQQLRSREFRRSMRKFGADEFRNAKRIVDFYNLPISSVMNGNPKWYFDENKQ